MSMPFRSSGIGIAIGDEALVASSGLLPGGVLGASLCGTPSATGQWPELETALADIRSRLPHDVKLRASFVVLPTIAQVRRLPLPALGADERRAILSRDAARWFVNAREPFVADALELPGRRGEVVAAALPSRFVDAIARATALAEMELVTIQAAPWAWAESLGTARRRATQVLVVGTPRLTTIIRLSRGVVEEVRRVRAAADVDAKLRELTGGTAAAADAERITDGLTAGARFAARARGPELIGQPMRAARRTAVMRRARTVGMAAAAMLLVAAGVDFWGVHRQLAIVRAERSRIRPDVARAMASRDSVAVLEAQLGAVVEQVRGAPQWTAVIANLAQFVPEDAWLRSLTAAGDSVSLVGEAAHAADVIESLRRDPAIAGLRADAPVRREVSPDRLPVEHFGLTVRLVQSRLASTQVKP